MNNADGREEAPRPRSCFLCFSFEERGRGLVCSANHLLCEDCVNGYCTANCSDIGMLLNTKMSRLCPHVEGNPHVRCTALYHPLYFRSQLKRETLDLYDQALLSTKRDAPREEQRGLADEADDAIAQSLLDALNIKCPNPNCAVHLDPDPDGCAAGRCAGCGTFLCFLCLEICRDNDTCHEHVRNCPHSPDPGNAWVPPNARGIPHKRLRLSALLEVVVGLSAEQTARCLGRVEEHLRGVEIRVAQVQRERDAVAATRQVELRRQQQIRQQHQRQQQMQLQLEQLKLLQDLQNLLSHPLKSLPQGPQRQQLQRRIQRQLQQLQQKIRQVQSQQPHMPQQETAEQEETRIVQQLVAAHTIRCPDASCTLPLVTEDRASDCCAGCGSHLCLLCLQICPSAVACLLHVRQCPHSPLPGCVVIPVADLEKARSRLRRNNVLPVLLPLSQAKAELYLLKAYEKVHGAGLMPQKELQMQKDLQLLLRHKKGLQRRCLFQCVALVVNNLLYLDI
ncbi:hypothetical protein B484DRAFT_443784 [Ochromonadaceae sp. CCMP2298]|nr:hypothetical protein B484DRAFT_443784 [Ochromonadaceae sp. CCMP2298]|mmetsp:Transcript_1209/g.2750  ORF Transcript_1209/g.2750 Transcript_1209/m.2750 type:complete len:507 (-) Transcript_1209:213-1733(-)